MQTRDQRIYKVTLTGSIVNMVLLVMKFMAGILGNSAAMVADAVHSLSDFLTDMKMPLHLKQRQLCLLDATQRIVWVVGQRISDNCRVSAGTKQILKMTFVTG